MTNETSLPPMTRTLLRGVLRRRAGVGGGRTVPRLETRAGPIRVDPSWLADFVAQTDGTPADTLPLIAPQLFAGPLHAKLLADAAMPLPMLGMVHVTQRTVRHRAMSVDEPLHLEVWVEGHRVARKGAEIDLHTVARVDGEPVWEGVTTALARGPWGDASLPSTPAPEPVAATRTWSWSVPASAGRQWRRVSGDPNPIHLSALTARLFGFPRAVAHGTWVLGRALAAIGEPAGPATVEVRFRRPVFLPSTAELWVDDSVGHFALVSEGGEVVHVAGTLTPGG